ncbi:MAG: hypothetical protein RL154_766 [Pseudomonadota bacterium]|jgi:hypothetical protein
MTVIIEATDATPKVILDFVSHNILISGESYPEDVNIFYGPIIEQIDGYLKSTQGQTIHIDINLKYFNSSSNKIFYNLFQMLESATENNTIVVNWRYAEEDDMSLETGESFKEDVEHLTFNLISYA